MKYGNLERAPIRQLPASFFFIDHELVSFEQVSFSEFESYSEYVALKRTRFTCIL